MSNFYIVATPIGNLGDITYRAVEILKSVDAVLCEDTRTTKKIFDKYGITTQAISFASDDHAKDSSPKLVKIFEMLEDGKNLALVSDAGTPGISDPGAMLVAKIKEKFSSASNTEVKVIPIPGASALVTALCASGLPIHEFTFLGFLPNKKGRETIFKEIASNERTFAFYESPHRILKTLESLQKFCPQKKVVLARELTKIYEEFLSGSPEELFAKLSSDPLKQKGEFTVLVA